MKKHIRCQRMNKNGKMILGVLYFFHTEKQFLRCGYCGTEASEVVNRACDKKERILILDAELNCANFLFINFYNSNIESEKLSTFSTLRKLLEKVDDYNKKKIIFGGDFNLIYDLSLMNLEETQY